jgi:FkbM family methyltransferase
MRAKRALVEAIRRGFQKLGVDIHRVKPPSAPTTHGLVEALVEIRDGTGPEFEFLRFCESRVSRSHSQLLQDLWVLHRLGEKRNGYFVEFGAADGVFLSNTCMLEREYGWSGIVAEPAQSWQAKLGAQRTCHVSNLCVWESSGATLEFNEPDAPELSTIARYSSADAHSGARAQGRHYSVRTISLADLLASHDAPAEIDYLSIDTEGSELRILSAFDFSRYRFACITVEHNYTPARMEIQELLARAGYKRVFDSLSRWDDWYVAA